MTIRVLIADDQDIIRAGLTTILKGQPGIEVVGQAADGHEAVELARRLRPDVCLFDIRMPRMDGVEATRQLAGPGVVDPLAVVIITTFDTDEYVTGALRAGAKGFLLKDAGPALLVQAIHAAAEGDALIAPSVTVRLLARFAESTPSRRPPLVAPLTDREKEVAVTVTEGLTNTEIAARLHITLSTVKFHVSSLMDKIGARNRVEVVIWAYETAVMSRSTPGHRTWQPDTPQSPSSKAHAAEANSECGASGQVDRSRSSSRSASDVSRRHTADRGFDTATLVPRGRPLNQLEWVDRRA